MEAELEQTDVEESDSESGVEERAERIVELEEEIADRESGDSDEDADVELDARLSSVVDRLTDATSGELREARVVGVEKGSIGGVAVRYLVDGEKCMSHLPMPDDPNDESEPVVRLCRRRGVDPKRLGDLDRVPVTTGGDRTRVVVPKGRDERSVGLTLPGGRRFSFAFETVDSRVGRYVQRWQHALSFTPIISGHPGNLSSGANRAIGSAISLMLLGGIIISHGLISSSLLTAFLGFVVVLLGPLTLKACANADFGDGYETY